MKTKEIDKVLDEIEKKKSKHLNTRQQALKSWLEGCFVSGKWWTIEEVVNNFRDSNGEPYYILNTNPRVHDKCVRLARDVKELNWHTGRQRYIPIIKNKQGSVKLCENKEELDEYISSEKKRIDNTYKYYKHLESLSKLDGTMPFVNQANRVLEISEMKPINIYQKEQGSNEEV